MKPLEFKRNQNSTSISFEVPKNRFSAMFSKTKTRTFYLTAPEPISDHKICSYPCVDRVFRDEEVSKSELARILALALTKRSRMHLPGYVWLLSMYLSAKLNFETLTSLAKIVITFSSYSALLQPFPDPITLSIVTRINRYYL